MLHPWEVTPDDQYPELSMEPPWAMFVDDTMLLDQVDKAVEESLQGQSEQVQKHLRRAYAWSGWKSLWIRRRCSFSTWR